MGMVKTERFSIWHVDLNPTKGSEQAGYRPVLIISPNLMNDYLRTVIVAPMTTTLREWPTRVAITHRGKTGEVALDQIRTIDKARLGKFMGTLDKKFHSQILVVLIDIFSE
jgi:mRNA interferase MazF